MRGVARIEYHSDRSGRLGEVARSEKPHPRRTSDDGAPSNSKSHAALGPPADSATMGGAPKGTILELS